MYTVDQLCHYSETIFSQQFQNIPTSSTTLNHNVLFFEISFSRHTCSQGTPSWPSLWLFSFRSSVFRSSSFFVVYTPPFLSFIYSSSCVTHGFLALLSTFPTKSLTESNIHFWILSQSTSTFPLSHLIPPSFSFGVLALSVARHVTSPDPILVYPFGTL